MHLARSVHTIGWILCCAFCLGWPARADASEPPPELRPLISYLSVAGERPDFLRVKLLIDQKFGLNILLLCKAVVAFDAKFDLGEMIMVVATHRLTNRINTIIRTPKSREEKVADIDAMLAEVRGAS